MHSPGTSTLSARPQLNRHNAWVVPRTIDHLLSVVLRRRSEDLPKEAVTDRPGPELRISTEQALPRLQIKNRWPRAKRPKQLTCRARGLIYSMTNLQPGESGPKARRSPTGGLSCHPHIHNEQMAQRTAGAPSPRPRQSFPHGFLRPFLSRPRIHPRNQPSNKALPLAQTGKPAYI